MAGSDRMIHLSPTMRILVAIEPVDLRKGIDGLAQLCREKLAADPFSGCLFIFRSRRATAIKLLQYDGQGFVLAQKRLSKGRFVWWPRAILIRTRRPCVNVEPFSWFKDVLARISNHPINRITELLPHNWVSAHA